MIHNITYDGTEPRSVTVFLASGPLVASSDHPNFDEILDTLVLLNDDEAYLAGLFDISVGIASKFEILGERVTTRGGCLYFDGDTITGPLVDAIVRYHTEKNEDYARLVLFLEKVSTNPTQHSRDNLYRWLNSNGFEIAADGDLIAYKGVRKSEDGKYTSTNQGKAIVDGVPVTGYIPTAPGSVVEMPRSEVQHDPSANCSTGLHAGNFAYAKGFGTVVLRVKINPRDVVSVPTETGDPKLRCCRYLVLDELTEAPNKMQFDCCPDGAVVLVVEDDEDDFYEDDFYGDDDDFGFGDEDVEAEPEADGPMPGDDDQPGPMPGDDDLDGMNRNEVRELARKRGIKNVSAHTKPELLDMLREQ